MSLLIGVFQLETGSVCNADISGGDASSDIGCWIVVDLKVFTTSGVAYGDVTGGGIEGVVKIIDLGIRLDLKIPGSAADLCFWS